MARDQPPRARGSLRIYLGASPGVGKTFKMLGEGVRRKERGTDVVIGVVETHGRSQTAAQMGDLEVVPRRTISYRDTVLTEMDVDAIIARAPQVVLVDEYAHTNVPGSRHEKRWQDVEELLDAGIDVISTLNIQHLESLNDVITRITGTTQRETVPDDIVRRADQLELVDMAPEAIRRRMAHGNIYPAERVDAALANYFRVGNLSALRELALLWVADRVEESLSSYFAAHGISENWETRERVVVGITGAPGGDAVIRRAARMAGRVGGELIGVHVAVDDGLSSNGGDDLVEQRTLVEELGGVVHDVIAPNTAEAVAAFARREKATQLVLGASRRSRWHEVLHGSFAATVARLAPEIDVHIIARADAPAPATTRRRRHLQIRTRGRVVAAIGMTVIGLPLLIAVTVPFRSDIALSTELLLALVVVLVIAATGGLVVGIVAAVVASLLVNWFFVPPYGRLTIAETENVISLAVFVIVAVAVGALVEHSSRRAIEARRARLEAESLVRASTSLAVDPHPVDRLIEQIQSTFALDGVCLVVHEEPERRVIAGDVAGVPSASVTIAPSAARPHGGASTDRRVLSLYGRPLSVDDERLLRALTDQLDVALDNQQLADEAHDAAALAEIDAVRTAMLRAVSHDLRTPLASIKAIVSGLRDPAVPWSEPEVSEALLTVEEETDRLTRLVANLLDASRLQIGTLAVDLRPTPIDEVVDAAVRSLGLAPGRVAIDESEHMIVARCDPTLLERSLANVIANADRYGPPDRPVRIDVAEIGDAVHVRIVDQGVGIGPEQRAGAVQPFQRLGDTPDGEGVGLGLSIAQGFVDAMGGTLSLDDTPGGGLTVTIVLPRALEPAAAPSKAGR
jgi:two-component system sensor histidine kinase KdpD